MANNRNEIVGSETDHIRQTDCFLHCNIPKSIDRCLSMCDQSEKQRHLHKILDDLIHFIVQIMKNKQVDFIIRNLNVDALCKLDEKTSTCVSRSSYGSNAIERDARIIDRIKRETIDAITSTARFDGDFNKAGRENLSSIIKDPVHDSVCLRCTNHAGKYVDNAVPQRCCAPRCTGIGIQSDIADEKFSSETSPDAFRKACEERRHADFILDEIARISDALTRRMHRTSAAESEKTDSSSYITLTPDEMKQEIFEKAKTLLSIILAQEKANDTTRGTVTRVVIQRRIFEDSRVSVASIHFVQELQYPSMRLDATGKSRDDARVRVISSIEESSKDESAHEAIRYPGKRDFQGTIVTATVIKSDKNHKNKEKRRQEDRSFLRSMLDAVVFAVFQEISIIYTVPKDDSRKKEEEERNGKEFDIFREVKEEDRDGEEIVISKKVEEEKKNEKDIDIFIKTEKDERNVKEIDISRKLKEEEVNEKKIGIFKKGEGEEEEKKSKETDIPRKKEEERDKEKISISKKLEEKEKNEKETDIYKKVKEEKENEKEIDISLQQILDKDVAVDDTVKTAVDFPIINSIQELKEYNEITFSLKQEVEREINDIVNSLVDISQVEQESKKTTKDILREVISFKHKMPKYRSIYASYFSNDISNFIERNYFTIKREKMPQCKKIQDPKNLNVSTCTFLSFASLEPTRSHCEKPPMKICQDDRSELPGILQPIRCCGTVIPSNIYLVKPKYRDIQTTSYFSPQNLATQEVTLSDVLCPPPQNSHAIGYHVNCRALINGNRNASLRPCNVDCCAKHRTYENLLCTIHDTHCRVGVKYFCPRLNNNNNNVRMGNYHCNNCSTWNNNRHRERNRSCHWWTRENLYFAHPWTTRHVSRYN